MAALGLRTIKRWFDHGKDIGATHMLVMHDVFDDEDGDYMILVKVGEDPKKIAASSGDLVMECYSYNVPWETQAAEPRANHWEMY